jgi:hypothetical protein
MLESELDSEYSLANTAMFRTTAWAKKDRCDWAGCKARGSTAFPAVRLGSCDWTAVTMLG